MLFRQYGMFDGVVAHYKGAARISRILQTLNLHTFANRPSDMLLQTAAFNPQTVYDVGNHAYPECVQETDVEAFYRFSSPVAVSIRLLAETRIAC